MANKGILIAVSAPSGAGKSTVLKRLMEKRLDLRFSVSATTRAPRLGEQEGVEYYFVTQARFQEMIAAGDFLEYARYVGNYYGTPHAPVDLLLDAGYDVYLDIEVQGAMQVRRQRPETLLIFLMPPSREELERRLVSRGQDHPEIIQGRLAEAERECAMRDKFDYVVVNEDVETAAEEISQIIDLWKKT